MMGSTIRPSSLEELICGRGAGLQRSAARREAAKESESCGVIIYDDFKTPWMKSYGDLIPFMEEIDAGMHKRIETFGDKTKGYIPDDAHVCVLFKSFWEGENIPFAGTTYLNDKLEFDMGALNVLPFFRRAVSTMLEGEKAQFLVSHTRMSVEALCALLPIMVPADSLIIIELLSFTPARKLYPSESLKLDKQQNFSLVLLAAEEIKLKAIDLFNRKMYKDAIKTFSKALNLMFPFNLTDADEEKALKDFQVKSYTNIIVCFNKLNLHHEACKIINEVKRVAGKEVALPTKVFYHEGLALMGTGDYENAEIALKKAISMDPLNKGISTKMTELNEKQKNVKSNEKELWGRAFKEYRLDPSKIEEKRNEDPLEEAIKRYFHTFKTYKVDNIVFPVAMWKNNVEMVERLAQGFQLKLDFDPKDKSKCVLRKLVH